MNHGGQDYCVGVAERPAINVHIGPKALTPDQGVVAVVLGLASDPLGLELGSNDTHLGIDVVVAVGRWPQAD